MADEVDLRYLSELLAQLEEDMRSVKSDMAEIRASGARVRSGVASLKADVARVEMKLDAFQEAVNDCFDRLCDLTNSLSRCPIAEQPRGSEDGSANDRNSRWREDRHVLE
jgi:septal ring factor EnvC (AmiA/AmiB activator)